MPQFKARHDNWLIGQNGLRFVCCFLHLAFGLRRATCCAYYQIVSLILEFPFYFYNSIFETPMIVDLRSDTVTQPTAGMLEAMLRAPLT
jgi:hypothetical protein